MEYQIGVLESENRVRLLTIDRTEQKLSEKLQDVSDDINLDINALFYKEENISDELPAQFQKQIQSIPKIDLNECHDLNVENLDSVEKAMNKFLPAWVYQNNLMTLKNIFETAEHLKALYAADYNTFFEELWNFLRINLGSTDLRVIFHDLKEGKGDNSDELIVSVAHGKTKAQLRNAENIEKKIFKNYSDYGTESFEVTEYDFEKGQLVAVAHINRSPVIMMANVFKMNPLQESVLTALFKGIQK